MELKQYKIKEIAELINGRAYLMPELQDSGKYRILRVGNFSSKDDWYYSDMELDDDKYCYENDLLFKWSCSFGPEIWKGEKTIYHYHIWKMIVNERIVNKIYLYYYLKYYTQFLLGGTNGTTMAHITKEIMENKKVLIHNDKHIQEKIAQILVCYDELIENNNKRIKLLEQMAEEIYKEWFVRFRFPGYENIKKSDSKIGKIPATFKIESIQNVLEYYIGGGWGNDEKSDKYSESAYVIRGTDFEDAKSINISSIPYRFHTQSNLKSRILKKNDIVIEISGGTQDQPVGRALLITEDLLDALNGDCMCASFCKQVRCNNKISPVYFYYWMKFLYDTRIIDRYQLQSTGIINFKFEYFLKKGFVLIPSQDIMAQFDELINPIIEEIGKLGRANQNLIKQRDLLLPRLMSGKLEIKED